MPEGEFQQQAAVQRRSLFVSAEGFNVFVEVDGAGPYMIMTHGLGTNTHVFQPLTEVFSSSYTVVRLDWPGHGHSSMCTTGKKLTVPRLADMLEALMDELGIPSAVLIGHSLGGIVSMMVAAKCPQRVRALAVLGAGRTRSAPPEKRATQLMLAQEVRERGLQILADAKVANNLPATAPALARTFLRAVTAASPAEGYAQTVEALCDASHVDPDYSSVVCPTCIVGGLHDSIAPVSVTDELVQLVAGSGRVPIRHILDTGHMMIIEDVVATELAIRAVLRCAGD